MLAIRMQRTGRKGHAHFRMVVQDSRRTPTSGNIVASVGSYNPHAKVATIDKEKISFYLEHGAQPSDRVARLLKSEGVKLPSWVKIETDKTRPIRNQEKLRKNRPPVPVEETPAVAEAEPEIVAPEETAAEAPTEETASAEEPATEVAEETAEAPAEDEPVEETPVEEVPTQTEEPAETPEKK